MTQHGGVLGRDRLEGFREVSGRFPGGSPEIVSGPWVVVPEYVSSGGTHGRNLLGPVGDTSRIPKTVEERKEEIANECPTALRRHSNCRVLYEWYQW